MRLSIAPIIVVIPSEVEESRGITQGFQWDSLISLCCARDDGSCEGGVVSWNLKNAVAARI
ncbi:MAG: hypothetical protein DME48_10690 [Verrucomicrobia bacterium]|nr:MAG: hypothetical protein DME48_10690 [Verrucomicrobiota bacterium]